MGFSASQAKVSQWGVRSGARAPAGSDLHGRRARMREPPASSSANEKNDRGRVLALSLLKAPPPIPPIPPDSPERRHPGAVAALIAAALATAATTHAHNVSERWPRHQSRLARHFALAQNECSGTLTSIVSRGRFARHVGACRKSAFKCSPSAPETCEDGPILMHDADLPARHLLPRGV